MNSEDVLVQIAGAYFNLVLCDYETPSLIGVVVFLGASVWVAKFQPLTLPIGWHHMGPVGWMT